MSTYGDGRVDFDRRRTWMRQYMRQYMRDYRAEHRHKPDPKPAPASTDVQPGWPDKSRLMAGR